MRPVRFVPDPIGRFPPGRTKRPDSLRDNVKRFFAIFVLTSREQRLVIFVVLALVVGAWFKHYRDMRINDEPERSAELSLTPLVSPTPNER